MHSLKFYKLLHMLHGEVIPATTIKVPSLSLSDDPGHIQTYVMFLILIYFYS